MAKRVFIARGIELRMLMENIEKFVMENIKESDGLEGDPEFPYISPNKEFSIILEVDEQKIT